MKKKIKKFIIPIIIVLVFSIVYLFVIPTIKKKNATNNLFKSFEEGITKLEIKYEKKELDASVFGANKAYSYTSNEKTIMLYVYNTNSNYYKQGLKNGYIDSKNNDESKLYGVMANNCVLYMESEFPHDTDVLELFQNLSKEYLEAL